MRQGLKLMVLAGTAEARQIAVAARDSRARVHALISEPPRGPNPMPVPCELHDFADLEGVIDRFRGYDAIVDASHGFDARMSQLGFAAAATLGVPFISFVRPAWILPPGTPALHVPTIADAVRHAGRRVFSATGWASLSDYVDFAGEKLFLRQTSTHDRTAPFDFVELVFGDPPFKEQDERATFKKLHVDTLICRDLGGRASYPKVAAALSLGIKVILIQRPALPEKARRVETVEGITAWINAL